MEALKVDVAESDIQRKIVVKLKKEGWYVIRIPCGMLLTGFPDLFATHKIHGVRLVEVKRPNMQGSRFTPAQIKVFPELARNGCGIWILTSPAEYDLLFRPPNFSAYFLEKLK